MSACGSWSTPITSELVVRAAARLGEVASSAYTSDDLHVWWAESRPQEGGRTQLVHEVGNEPPVDVLPEGFNARTAVHEYGGGAWWLVGAEVWFANWEDQRLYRLADGAPEPVTPEPAVPRGDRWADGHADASGRWVVAVRERHRANGTPADVANELVVLDAAGENAPRVVVSGADFVSNPRWSPDGTQLCWVQWHHPDMPWDGTELMVASVAWGDDAPKLGSVEVAAGRPHRARGSAGDGEAAIQPRWHTDGSLWFISDRSGWGNLYRWTPEGGAEPTVVLDAEIGEPQWVFGQSRYALIDTAEAAGTQIVFALRRDGSDRLAIAGDAGGAVIELDLPYTSISSVTSAGGDVVCVAASATAEPAVVRLTVATADRSPPAGTVKVLREPRDLGLGEAWFSVPEPIAFPSSDGRTAHALFYPPANPNEQAPVDELPPLLVFIHGGPTSAARPMLQLGVQYWTSRGFAVVDVNYGGSTGYGRDYLRQLDGAWGVVDTADCAAAARWLADQGRVDAKRLAIRGGSAGGYTTLAALAFGDTFAAGASHYGVADLEALATETHKFESRYLDGLIGPYPEARDAYVARSPIHHVEDFNRPLIVLQGLEDEVVPPSQAEMIVDALRAKGVPVAYLAFPGEQHGFRQGPNIRRALDAELSFYAQVFGFDLPAEEGIEPVAIDNL